MCEHIHFSFRELHTNHLNFRSSEIGNNILLARIIRTNFDCGGVMRHAMSVCGRQWMRILQWQAMDRNSLMACSG